MLSCLSTVSVHRLACSNNSPIGTITITNDLKTLTDWTVSCILPYKVEFNPQFNNLIFKDEQNNVLNFWYEYVVQGTNAKVWLKIHQLTIPSCKVNVFLSQGTVIPSDPSTIFLLYDNFMNLPTSASFQSNDKWTSYSDMSSPGNKYYSVPQNGSGLYMSGTWGWSSNGKYESTCILSKNIFPTNIVVEAGVYTTKQTNNSIAVNANYQNASGLQATFSSYPSTPGNNNGLDLMSSYDPLNSVILSNPMTYTAVQTTNNEQVIRLVTIDRTFKSYLNNIPGQTYTLDNTQVSTNKYLSQGNIIIGTARNPNYWKWIQVYPSASNNLAFSYNWQNASLSKLNDSQQGLIVYYKFLSNDKNSTTNKIFNYANSTYDLTLTYRATIVSGGYNAQTPTSLYLDNGYAIIGSPITITNQGFTACAWIKNSNINNVQPRLFTFNTSDTQEYPKIDFSLAVNQNYNYPYVGIGNSAATYVNNNSTFQSAVITKNFWVHIAWVIEYKASGPYANTLYIDGKFGSSFTTTQYPAAGDRTYNLLGGYIPIPPDNAISFLFQGNMNEFRIYNRSLSANEIRVLAEK
jgi:Concanavalin A-like lectin/glucanases superfamily